MRRPQLCRGKRPAINRLNFQFAFSKHFKLWICYLKKSGFAVQTLHLNSCSWSRSTQNLRVTGGLDFLWRHRKVDREREYGPSFFVRCLQRKSGLQVSSTEGLVSRKVFVQPNRTYLTWQVNSSSDSLMKPQKLSQEDRIQEKIKFCRDYKIFFHSWVEIFCAVCLYLPLKKCSLKGVIVVRFDFTMFMKTSERT